jgi:hypothetical protein
MKKSLQNAESRNIDEKVLSQSIKQNTILKKKKSI